MKRGFSAVELITSIVILLIVFGILFTVYISSLRNLSAEFDKSDLRNSADLALNKMIKELSGILRINGYTSTSINFWLADSDQNSIQSTDEAVTYTWSGTPGDKLFRIQGSDSFILADHVQNFIVSYNLTQEVLSLSLQVKTGNAEFIINSKVKPRNI